METTQQEHQRTALERATRRHFLQTCSTGLGALALSSLWAGCRPAPKGAEPTAPTLSRAVPKAKRVIYIHMAGAPSQLDLFDYKPDLIKHSGQECPQEFLAGRQFVRNVPKLLGPQGRFAQHGQSGAWVSDYLPHLQGVVDDLTFIKAVHTDQHNHAPAQLLLHTGAARPGQPSLGSWVTYGLGLENENLPGYLVLASGGRPIDVSPSLWTNGFLPATYGGIPYTAPGEPVSSDMDGPTGLIQSEQVCRLQLAQSEAMDLKGESQAVLDAYGVHPAQHSFARNCLLTRRLVERGVRFVQLFDWGWDTHGTSRDSSLDFGLRAKCRASDGAVTALLKDLKQRGLLDETLVVWGGEFGRTPMQETRDGQTLPYLGRDHNPDAFTVWMAGAGVKKGFSYGETDAIGLQGVKDRVHVHDLQATLLHLLGSAQDTNRFRDYASPLMHEQGKVVQELLA